MKNLLKKIFNPRVIIITVCIFSLCLSFHWVFFDEPYKLTRLRVFYKLLHFVFLYLIVFYLDYLITHIKEPKNKINLIIFASFFAIMLIFVVLTWPGTWSWDDISILYQSQRYKFHAWQHFLSNIFQILYLETLPFIAGVPIMQSFLAALIVGYVVSNLAFLYGKTQKQRVILICGLLLIALAPPQVVYLLSGFRMGMYTYLEFLFIGHLIVLYKNKISLTWLQLAFIGLLTVLLASWRSEAIYYPVIMFLIFLLFGKKRIRLWKNLLVCGMAIVLTLGVSAVNTRLIGNSKYSLTATMEPATKLVQIADESDAKELEKINHVFDVEKIKANPGYTGEVYFWSTDGYVRDYTQAEYHDYLIAVAVLAIKYPNVVWQDLWDIFCETGIGTLYKDGITCRNIIFASGNSLELFEDNFPIKGTWDNIADRLKGPINSDVRKNVIAFLSGSNAIDNANIFYGIAWNLFIPFVLIGLCLIYKLFSKKWFDLFIILLVVVRIPVVFIFSSAPYFMYYLPTYFCSYALAFIFVFELITRKKVIQNGVIDNHVLQQFSSGGNTWVISTPSQLEEPQKKLKKTLLQQFFSFLLVSGVGWLIDFTIYTLLTKLTGMQVVFANMISSIPAITYVFLMSYKTIFKNKNSKLNLKLKYLIYFAYQIVVILLMSGLGQLLYNGLIGFVAFDLIKNNFKILIKILITPITMITNFIFAKILIEKL